VKFRAASRHLRSGQKALPREAGLICAETLGKPQTPAELA